MLFDKSSGKPIDAEARYFLQQIKIKIDSKMKEEIKKKIEQKVSDECILNSQDGLLRQRFAYFGYSLSQEQLAAKEKEIAELKNMNSALYQMTNDFTAEIERLKEDSDKKCIDFAQWCSKKNIYPNDFSLKQFKAENKI